MNFWSHQDTPMIALPYFHEQSCLSDSCYIYSGYLDLCVPSRIMVYPVSFLTAELCVLMNFTGERTNFTRIFELRIR